MNFITAFSIVTVVFNAATGVAAIYWGVLGDLLWYYSAVLFVLLILLGISYFDSRPFTFYKICYLVVFNAVAVLVWAFELLPMLEMLCKRNT